MENITKNIVNDTKKGYITGFFDAEGSLWITNNYILVVSIGQSYKPVLERINNEFKIPSEIYVQREENYDKRKVHRKKSWAWKSTSDNTIPFLEYIYRYSIEKQSQIELALKYQKEIKISHLGSNQLTQVEIEQRNWFKNKLEELKNETRDNQTLKNYDNEIKLMKIPKDIREGKQLLLMPLEEWYKFNGININKTNKVNEISLNNLNKKQRQMTNNQDIYKMTEYIEIGYLSGFFDGEGYVGISKGKSSSYGLHVSIGNSNFNILKIYEVKFGGKIRHKQKTKSYYKEKYEWQITNHNTLPFLKMIRNYTIVKKSQIDIAIEFQEWHDSIGIIKTSDQKQKVERYYNILRELKKETGETTNETISNCKLVKQQSKSLADYD